MSILNWFNYMMGGGGGGGGRTITRKKETVTVEISEISDGHGPSTSSGPGGNGPEGGGKGPGGGEENDHENDQEEEEENSRETEPEEEDDGDNGDDEEIELGTVVHAAQRIPYGAILTDEDVDLMVYPKKWITRAMLTDTDQAVGKFAAQEIHAHTIITRGMLASPHWYVTAARTIRAGQVIRSGDVLRSAFFNSSTSRFTDKEQVIGKRATRMIPQNAVITKSMLE